MAGTGNVEVLRICRCLRSRICQASNTVVTYGSHLATHMALGLLFLGGGRYSLSTSPESIAALIIAFYPKFPTHSNDNRSLIFILRMWNFESKKLTLIVKIAQISPASFSTFIRSRCRIETSDASRYRRWISSLCKCKYEIHRYQILQKSRGETDGSMFVTRTEISETGNTFLCRRIRSFMLVVCLIILF